MKFAVLFYLSFICSQAFCQKNSTAIITFNTTHARLGRGSAYIEIKKFQRDSGNYTVLKKIDIVKPIFSISIQADDPISCKLWLKSSDSSVYYDSPLFYITNESIAVSFDSSDVFIKSRQNDFFQKNVFVYLAMPAMIRMNSKFSNALLRQSYELVPDWRDKETIFIKSYIKEYEDRVIDVVRANRVYYRTLEALYEIRDGLTVRTLDTCFSIVKGVYKNASLTKDLQEYIEQSKKLFNGKLVPVFSVADMNSNTIASPAIYGRYPFTFLDFGASWCAPCRVQIKQIQRIYKTIDTSQVQIISVSIDDKKENWLAAIKRESITWKTYIDLKGGWNGDVAKNFNLTGIPSNVVVNKTGKIVAIDLTFDELEIFLQENGLIKK